MLAANEAHNVEVGWMDPLVCWTSVLQPMVRVNAQDPGVQETSAYGSTVPEYW